jgi:FkbM family methyltransferase
MPLTDKMKALLDRNGLRFAFTPVVSRLARSQEKGVNRVFYDSGVWIHDTTAGYFAYHQPFVRVDMAELDKVAESNFFWGYRPQPGDVVMDIGAGVGEEALTFSRAVGERGKVLCIEAHPLTYRCLEKLVEYNHLENVIPIHMAVTERSCGTAMIENSNAYLTNRLNSANGVPVPTTTIDQISRKLSLGRIQFLKMNIEGAERSAIRGMTETLRQTEVLCISCHDFLARKTGDDALKTKSTVKQFFQENGFHIDERLEPGLPPYLRDQVWGYNPQFMKIKRPAS